MPISCLFSFFAFGFPAGNVLPFYTATVSHGISYAFLFFCLILSSHSHSCLMLLGYRMCNYLYVYVVWIET